MKWTLALVQMWTLPPMLFKNGQYSQGTVSVELKRNAEEKQNLEEIQKRLQDD